MCGKEKIPAIVRQVSNQQAMEMTLVENLQREDLNRLTRRAPISGCRRSSA